MGFVFKWILILPDTWELWPMCGRWGQALQLQPSNQDPSVSRVKSWETIILKRIKRYNANETFSVRKVNVLHSLINTFKALPWWASEPWRIPWYLLQPPTHQNKQNCHRFRNSFGDLRNNRLCLLGSFELLCCNCTLTRKASVLIVSFSLEKIYIFNNKSLPQLTWLHRNTQMKLPGKLCMWEFLEGPVLPLQNILAKVVYVDLFF